VSGYWKAGPPGWRLLIVGAMSAVVACGSGRDGARDSAAGAVDSSAARDSSVNAMAGATPAIGPLVQVTKTDARSVRDATGYRLTDENFRKFMAAAESLSVLRARDPGVRQLADQRLAEAGSSEEDAGLKLLQSNDAVSKAIESAGLSVRDYFVMGIALASASRFMDTPDAAPPTPATEENARFIRAHASDLARLRHLTEGAVVTSGS
jgi:hypothetical protein